MATVRVRIVILTVRITLSVCPFNRMAHTANSEMVLGFPCPAMTDAAPRLGDTIAVESRSFELSILVQYAAFQEEKTSS
jgi:hypothetical protein